MISEWLTNRSNPSELNDSADPAVSKDIEIPQSVVYVGSGQPLRFTFGDFNGDGFEDAALNFVRDSDQRGTVQIVNGTKDGFDVSKIVSLTANVAGAKVSALAAGDFNNDGFDDLGILVSVPNAAPNILASIAVIDGSRDELDPDKTTSLEFTADVSAADTATVSRIVAGDFNKDGIDDLGIGVQIRQTGASPTVNFNLVVAGDFNKDGIDDLVAFSVQIRQTGASSIENFNLFIPGSPSGLNPSTLYVVRDFDDCESTLRPRSIAVASMEQETRLGLFQLVFESLDLDKSNSSLVQHTSDSQFSELDQSKSVLSTPAHREVAQPTALDTASACLHPAALPQMSARDVLRTTTPTFGTTEHGDGGYGMGLAAGIVAAAVVTDFANMDAKIVQLLADGKTNEALQTILREYGGAARSAIRKYGSRVEQYVDDILSEALVVIWQKYQSSEGALHSFFMKVVLNRAIDMYRKFSREKRVNFVAEPHRAPSAEDNVDFQDALIDAMEKLPPLLRALVGIDKEAGGRGKTSYQMSIQLLRERQLINGDDCPTATQLAKYRTKAYEQLRLHLRLSFPDHYDSYAMRGK